MGNIVYWMNVSLDLRIEHAAGEQGGGSWMRIGDSSSSVQRARAAARAAGDAAGGAAMHRYAVSR